MRQPHTLQHVSSRKPWVREPLLALSWRCQVGTDCVRGISQCYVQYHSCSAWLRSGVADLCPSVVFVLLSLSSGLSVVSVSQASVRRSFAWHADGAVTAVAAPRCLGSLFSQPVGWSLCRIARHWQSTRLAIVSVCVAVNMCHELKPSCRMSVTCLSSLLRKSISVSRDSDLMLGSMFFDCVF